MCKILQPTNRTATGLYRGIVEFNDTIAPGDKIEAQFRGRFGPGCDIPLSRDPAVNVGNVRAVEYGQGRTELFIRSHVDLTVGDAPRWTKPLFRALD